MARKARSDNAPPCDLYAEQRVLVAFIMRPHQIPLYPEVSGLLWSGEHSQIWQCMRQCDTSLSPGDFTYALMERLCARYPNDWGRLWDLLNEEYEGNYVLVRNQRVSRLKTFADCMERLERCAYARRLVNVAQEIAEHAWKCDTESARQAMDRWYPVRST